MVTNKFRTIFAALLVISMIALAIPIAYAVVQTVVSNSPANGTVTSDTTPDFNFTMTSDSSGNHSCTLYVGGTNVGSNATTANNTATIITSSVLSNGAKTWYVSCIDLVTRVNSTSITITIDTVAPTVTPNTANNTNTSNSTPGFNFTYTDAQASTASCTLFVDSVAKGTNSSTRNSTATIITSNATLTDGARSWYVNCTDSAGNVGQSTARTINIDTVLPVVSLNSPANNTNTSDNTPDINFTVTNAVSVLSCTLFVDGTAKGTNSSVLNNTATVMTANASLSDGARSWYVNCTDSSSNTGQSATRTINVDTVAPAVTANSPANGANTSDSTPDFNFTYTDARAATATCTLFINNTARGTNSSTKNNTATVITSNASLSNNTYSWRVNCTDSVNNVGASSTRNITIIPDTVKPTITAVYATGTSADSSNILWTTDELANSTVNYGTTTSLGTAQSDPTYSTSHTIGLYGLSPEVTYYYTVTSCDYSSNCNTTGLNSFTTTQSSGVEAAAGGGISGTPSTETAISEQVPAEQTVTLTNFQGPVSSIEIDTALAIRNSDLRLSVLSSGQPIPNAQAFTYFEITSGIPEAAMRSARIIFKVDKSWLEQNGFSPDDVVLYRFNSGVWTNLQTERTGETASDYTYRATTPGFSTFAIAATKQIPIAPVTAPVLTGAASAGPLGAFGGNAGLIVMVVIIVMFAIVMYRGQKKGRKR